MKIIFILSFLFFIDVVFSELLDLTKLIDLTKITDINITKEICDNIRNEQKELGKLSKSYVKKNGSIDYNKVDKNTVNIIMKKMMDNVKINFKCDEKFKIKTQEEIKLENNVENYFKDKANNYRDLIKKINNGCVHCKNDFGEDKCMKHSAGVPYCPRKEFKKCTTAQECGTGKVCSDGFCVVGNHKEAISWQDLGHTRLGN